MTDFCCWKDCKTAPLLVLGPVTDLGLNMYHGKSIISIFKVVINYSYVNYSASIYIYINIRTKGHFELGFVEEQRGAVYFTRKEYPGTRTVSWKGPRDIWLYNYTCIMYNYCTV